MGDILTEQIDALKEKQRDPTLSPPSRRKEDENKKETKQKLPKGVVLDKDGKPCRTCTSAADWRALARMKSPSTASSSAADPTTSPVTTTTNDSSSAATNSTVPDDCPPDVEALGRGTWTLLHSMAATYPSKASQEQQRDMQSFLSLFSKLYPCWVCADDFRAWMNQPGNKPRLTGRSEFGNWMCEAHNDVNRKLGKKEFDCSKWEERWRTGWKDGRCD